MSPSLCSSCHIFFRQRLQVRILQLRGLRRSNSTSTKESQSWYNDTAAPTSTQLHAAEQFFLAHEPRLLWTDTEWRKRNKKSTYDDNELIPELAFLGRSNVGKSSLLNALVATPALNRVGPRPGKTTAMRAWALARTKPKTGGAVKGMDGDGAIKCAVLDMPGYGHKSHRAWGDEIMKYLSNRKQLKRAFVVFDAQHGLLNYDLRILRLLRREGISCQIVASKCDKLEKTDIDGMLQTMWNRVQEEVTGPGLDVLGEVLVVGSLGDGRMNDNVVYSNMKGVDELRWAVLRAIGLEDYAVTKFPVGTTSKPPPSAEDLKEVVSSLTKMLQDDDKKSVKPEPPVQPQPAQSQPAPFTWPAKLRQPASITSAAETATDLPISPHLTKPTLKPMNRPASLSELQPLSSSFKSPSTLAPAPQPPPVGSSPSIGRGMDGLIDMIHPPKKPSTGFASPSIGRGMEGLTAMISRSKANLPAFRPSRVNLKPRPSRAAKSTGRSRPQKARSALQQQAEFNASASKQKEPWTGSSVGGMADLEAMLKRSSRPSADGRRGKRGGSGKRTQPEKMKR